jgi:DNA modification methylase
VQCLGLSKNMIYYQDEYCTLYHDKCQDILNELKFDAIITDPPYGVDLKYGDRTNDSFEEWQHLMDWLMPFIIDSDIPSFIPTSKIEGEQYLYANYCPKWRICWYKGATSTRCSTGFKDWEHIFVYGKVKRMFHDYFACNTEPHTSEFRKSHPCPKPIGWARWLLDKTVCASDVIVDPFSGTGTTLAAAKERNMKCIGIEAEEKYCEIISKRLSQEVFAF